MRAKAASDPHATASPFHMGRTKRVRAVRMVNEILERMMASYRYIHLILYLARGRGFAVD
jgi:hypothetical protein